MLSSLGFKTGIRAQYNVSDNPTFVSEPWAIYPAKHKSGRIVSVFIFDKTKFESQVQRISQTTNPKKIIKECYELIKSEVNQLSKLKHPQILTIYEVLEETKTKFLFVSESIGNNLITAGNLDSLSIQKGLLQCAKGLQFLHSNNIIHLNIQPSSIFINNQGDWKLAGFKFLQNLNEISPQERDSFFISNSTVPFANLNLSFTSPELIESGRLENTTDVWSFGMLIYFLYNHEFLINADDLQEYKQEFKKFERKFYNHKPTELKYILKDVPEKLFILFPKILARYPYDRLTLDQFIDSDFFNGSIIKAMWFIDEFSTKTINEKIVFLKGLLDDDATLINQFPPAFKSSKLLPLLIGVLINELTVLDESVVIDPNVDELICLSLEIILLISKSLSALTFQDRVFNVLFKDNTTFTEKVYDVIFKDEKVKKLKTFTKLINASVKTRLVLINNLPVLQEKSNDKLFTGFIKSILDLVFTLSPKEQDQKDIQIQLQETFLTSLPNFVNKFEFPYIKNTLFPLLCKIFQSTTVYSTKLKIIDTFDAFIDKKVIDRIIIEEQLLVVTKTIKNKDQDIIIKLLTLFEKIITSEHVNLDLKTSIELLLPQCFLFAFNCECDQKEFKNFISIINKIQKQLVEKKLSQLPTISPTSKNGTSNNFDTLLQSQTIKQPEKEEQAPKSKVLQPTTKASQPTSKVLQPSKPKPKLTSTLTPTSRATSNQPHRQPLTSHKPTSTLSFGATNSNTNNNNLLNNLKSTFEQNNYKHNEDEFDDFQSAANNIKNDNFNRMKNLPITPTNPTPASNSSMMMNYKSNVNNVNYPPGFNTVLSPKGNQTQHSTTSNYQNNNNNNNNTNINSDLLDLL
ncbi:ppk32 [Candida pseudojiufengensis]|uniref:ppk32 n=1 Tax=Candida pseudojiufengensis TaxID=497109 RepID=UPI002224C0B7|nr:ppk32 [Candida pseudojiufengensis]KAI5966526.1 ppk32 [Candida pseudojiufengensis]